VGKGRTGWRCVEETAGSEGLSDLFADVVSSQDDAGVALGKQWPLRSGNRGQGVAAGLLVD